MDRPSQTDPIWTVAAAQDGPMPVTRLSGEVVWINPSDPGEPDDLVLTPEEDQCLAGVTLSGRSELRSEIETVFGGSAWPEASAIVAPFRRYATKVYDANATAYRKSVSTQGKNPEEVLVALAHNLLTSIFGIEWTSSPGEQVVRTDWQHGTKGWKGREVVVIAGNDPDPNCLYHLLISEAIKYRYRFHAPPPDPLPGEPPGINLSNVEWWKYIGLNERHNLATAIKPYIDDRIAHWRVIYAAPAPTNVGSTVEPHNRPATASGVSGDDGEDGETGHRRKAQPDFPKRAAWLRERLAERAWNRNDPLRFRGPDPKTVDKILRGEAVREDVLEKLATALSKKGGGVNLLNIPRN
jgi:hypothetical protein